ncbi:hypothetical protein EDB86DRAFT_1652206 [Lactarius hatsudake]|nr:hypothetical protein EDB86DRAFT_1652206 [Lactarius hatsudake]
MLRVGNLPGPENIAETLPALFPGYHALKNCSETLQKIRELFDGLSEHRRRKILTASQRGACLPLESLELDLERLVDNYRDLCTVYEQSTLFQRSFLSKRFQADIIGLESQVREFYQDSWVSVFSRSDTFSLFHRRKRPRLGTGRSTGGL